MDEAEKATEISETEQRAYVQYYARGGLNAIEHLPKALDEYAEALGKPIKDLTDLERRQAFCSYIMSGKHLEEEE